MSGDYGNTSWCQRECAQEKCEKCFTEKHAERAMRENSRVTFRDWSTDDDVCLGYVPTGEDEGNE